jgi:DMSO/TMAO reductase YedYZ molybdopterin-dependent catalytic subunit
VRLNRRSFIKLIPVAAVALVGGSWWFLRRTTGEPMIVPQSTATTSNVSHTTTTPMVSGTESTASVTPQPTSTTQKAFDFPVTWNGDQPTLVNPNDYRLRVDGDVSKPLELTLEELYAMSNDKKTLKIICETGWAADVPWEGIPLSYLLSQAGASLEKIDYVTVESVKGYYTTMSSNEVANPDSMIALRVGALPLTIDHGYPARLVAPTKLGLDWVKYVARITCKNK